MSAIDAARVQSEIRRLYAPEFPGPNTKTSTCRQCGEPFLEWVGSYHRYCPDCSYERQVAASSGQENKAGPLYERYVLAQLKHWIGECERLGILP